MNPLPDSQTTLDDLAHDFLAQQRIAVAGVSEKRETPANLIYRTLKAKGYTVFAVSPHLQEWKGDPCYPDLLSLPVTPDGAVLVTRPTVTEKLVRQCVEARIPRVWLHCMLGTRPTLFKGLAPTVTSVSPEAVQIGREQGLTVIPGSCPLQFLGDFGHTCMRGLLRMTGALEMPQASMHAA